MTESMIASLFRREDKTLVEGDDLECEAEETLACPSIFARVAIFVRDGRLRAIETAVVDIVLPRGFALVFLFWCRLCVQIERAERLHA